MTIQTIIYIYISICMRIVSFIILLNELTIVIVHSFHAVLTQVEDMKIRVVVIEREISCELGFGVLLLLKW